MTASITSVTVFKLESENFSTELLLTSNPFFGPAAIIHKKNEDCLADYLELKRKTAQQRRRVCQCDNVFAVLLQTTKNVQIPAEQNDS